MLSFSLSNVSFLIYDLLQCFQELTIIVIFLCMLYVFVYVIFCLCSVVKYNFSIHVETYRALERLRSSKEYS